MADERYVTISEGVFRDLLNEKSKINDIKALLWSRSRVPKHVMMKQLADIVFNNRYNDIGGVIDGNKQ